MKFLVDVGNSRAKWACFDGRKLSGYGSFVHRDAGAKTGELRATARHALEGAWSPPRRVLLLRGGVHAARDTALLGSTSLALRGRVRTVRGRGTWCKNAYPEPHTLGADRWVALVAARQLCTPGAVCIVDCGTAVTVDVLRKDGAARGRADPPWARADARKVCGRVPARSDYPRRRPHRSARALHDGRRRIGYITRRRGGGRTRARAMCERSLARVLCVLTGGDAQPVMQALRVPTVWEPHLVLRGLGVLAGYSS